MDNWLTSRVASLIPASRVASVIPAVLPQATADASSCVNRCVYSSPPSCYRGQVGLCCSDGQGGWYVAAWSNQCCSA
jgi:hypothetical protein